RLGQRSPGAMLVDVADFEFLEIASRGLAVALLADSPCPADHTSPLVIDALREIVGKSNVLTAPEDTRPYFTDWRRQYSAPAECAVRPGTTAEVSRVVALCAREGVAVVPQGGNTGLVGGSVPTGARRELVLALGRMNRIRDLDALNDTITVEAGCVLAPVQRAAQ